MLGYSNVLTVTRGRTIRGQVPNAECAQWTNDDRTEPYVGAMVVREHYRKFKEIRLLELLYVHSAVQRRTNGGEAGPFWFLLVSFGFFWFRFVCFRVSFHFFSFPFFSFLSFGFVSFDFVWFAARTPHGVGVW